MMSSDVDAYIFEFGELKGKAYYSAFGKVSLSVLRAYRESKHYETMLSAFLQRLFVDPVAVSPENLKQLEGAFLERVNELLAEERAQDKERLVKGRKPLMELQQDDDEEYDEEEVEALTAEELERREAERLEAERLEVERAAAREAERQRNEEALRARARQVDTQAVARLQQATVLNPGAAQQRQKGGGKQQATAEDVAAMEAQVAQLASERERLQAVLRTSDDELPALLAEVTRQRDAAAAKASGAAEAKAPAKAMQPKQLNARVAELKQKVTKLTAERNRLALQLKAEPSPKRDEVLAVMQQRDEAGAGLHQHD